MSESVIIALLVAVPLTLTALANLLVAIKTLLVAQATHKEVNSKLSALVKAEKIVSFEAGVTASNALHDVPARPRVPRSDEDW